MWSVIRRVFWTTPSTIHKGTMLTKISDKCPTSYQAFWHVNIPNKITSKNTFYLTLKSQHLKKMSPTHLWWAIAKILHTRLLRTKIHYSFHERGEIFNAVKLLGSRDFLWELGIRSCCAPQLCLSGVRRNNITANRKQGQWRREASACAQLELNAVTTGVWKERGMPVGSPTMIVRQRREDTRLQHVLCLHSEVHSPRSALVPMSDCFHVPQSTKLLLLVSLSQLTYSAWRAWMVNAVAPLRNAALTTKHSSHLCS